MDGMPAMSPPPQPSSMESISSTIQSMSLPMESMSSPMKSMEGMRSSFYWGSDVVFFFADWPSGHVGMYILALALLFIISVFYEYLANPRGYRGGNGAWVAGGLVDTLCYTVRVAIAYSLMLAVMSYNLGVIIVVIVGSVIGFYVFRR